MASMRSCSHDAPPALRAGLAGLGVVCTLMLAACDAAPTAPTAAPRAHDGSDASRAPHDTQAAPGDRDDRGDRDTAPPMTDLDALAQQLMADVRLLADDALAGRAPDTPGSAAARAHIIGRLEALGVAPVVEGYVQPFITTPRGSPIDGPRLTAVNVLAEFPGATPGGPAMVLTAHYDHLGVVDGEIYNGADDNASGTAALLAVAAHFAAHPPHHRVVLAWLDNEEAGFRGAAAFMQSGVLARADMALNINLDMVARGDTGALYAAGVYHTAELGPLVQMAAARAPIVLRQGYDEPTGDRRDWTLLSDHAVFHERGVPFLYFGVEDHVDYHKPTDDAERIDSVFFAGAVATMLDVIIQADAQLPTFQAISHNRLTAPSAP